MVSKFINQSRLSRKDYWLLMIIEWGILILLALIWTPIALEGFEGLTEEARDAEGVKIFNQIMLFMLPFIVLNIMAMVKRLHDINKSGWYMLIVVIPSLGSLILFIFTLMGGTKETNNFGEIPEPIFGSNKAL